jgi:uncharacterized protein
LQYACLFPNEASAVPSFNTASVPLTESEIDELGDFMLYELDADEGMTLEMLDGFLHALAIGPTTVMPSRWLPAVWGEGGMLPPKVSLVRAERIVGLIFRHYNEVINGFGTEFPSVTPIWSTREFEGKEYEDGEMWAYGFNEGVKLCAKEWAPMLAQDDFSDDQDVLTETPAQREVLASQMLDAVLAMHRYWLPLRLAVHQRTVAKTFAAKVGRNEPCPCGSGKKFKKCCGAAADLH